MISSYLSSQVLALPSSSREMQMCVDIVKAWSREAEFSQNEDGAFFWNDTTGYEEQGYRWISTPPPADIVFRNGLIPLGYVNHFLMVAYVAPMKGLVASFKSAAKSFVRSEAKRYGADALTTDLIVDLREFFKDNLARPPFQSVSAMLSDGSHIVLSFQDGDRPLSEGKAGRRSPFLNPDMVHDLDAVEFVSEGKSNTVHRNFSLQLSDIAADDDEVTHEVRRTFALLERYVRIAYSPD